MHNSRDRFWRPDFRGDKSVLSDSEMASGFVPPELFFNLDIEVYEIDCSADAKGLETIRFSKKHRLPFLAKLWGEELFADVFMGWSSSGLFFQFDVESRAIAVNYPDVERGDSVELFIDTRHSRLHRLPTRFCHHFYFLPEKFEGRDRGECTRLRQEEMRPLANADDLEMKTVKIRNGYSMLIALPARILSGFLPKESPLGFTYRINRNNNFGQCFSCGLSVGRIESEPFRWASLILK